MLSIRNANYFIVFLLFPVVMRSDSPAQEKLSLNKTRVTLNVGSQFPVSSFKDSVETGYGTLFSFDDSPTSTPFSFSAGFNY